MPAEALLATIEVKSLLNKEGIKQVLLSSDKLQKLRPFGNKPDESKRQRRIEEKVSCRYYHCVFAYASDLAENNWAQCEFDRIKEVAQNLGVSYMGIDRVIVLKRGFLSVNHKTGISSNNDTQSLLYFYMNLLNFLVRENKRREIVPYLDYAGKLSKGWQKLI